ncbi:MAG: sigma-54 dependent transcriptional regulator [Rhodomicrobium sp.]
MWLEKRSIAVIEDDPTMGRSLVQCLSLEGASVDWFPSGRAALKGLPERRRDLVLCDVCLPDTRGDELFRSVATGAPCPPFIFMTAYGTVDEAVALMQAGAGSYLLKPFEMDVLFERIARALRCPESSAVTTLGISPNITRVEQLLRRLSGSPASVLITGETGAGKEVCARLLHQLAPKPDQPFMALNCAAIPDQLLESEIFGHEAGAFTTANKRHLGYAERAREGTLFLDEIGELPLAMQAKLLRLLEDRSFFRLGGETPVAFKARLVCATNSNLAALVKSGRFRPDLYYRINVVDVHVPPLRDRVEDIPWLIDRFFQEFAARSDRGLRGVSSLAEDAACHHPWPGNVRELKNRIERAVALTLNPCIMPADLFPEHAAGVFTESDLSLTAARDAAEKREIMRALERHDGQVGKAADALHISRTTLWSKMKRFGLTGTQAVKNVQLSEQ